MGAVHNFRWKRPDGRVSWMYRTRIAALSVERRMPRGSVLETSPDNGATWVAESTGRESGDA